MSVPFCSILQALVAVSGFDVHLSSEVHSLIVMLFLPRLTVLQISCNQSYLQGIHACDLLADDTCMDVY